MRVALLTDTHFGWQNDSLVFQDYFKRFYDDIFFPSLHTHHIKHIVHLGDIFDRRKYINFHILHRTKKEVLERLNNFETHIIIGNHDCYYRSDNSVNSAAELCSHYSNFRIYEEPEEIILGGLRILIMPWLNPLNMEPGLEMVKRSKASILMGHLELQGFHYDRSVVCEHGLDRKLFKRFKRVFSGHFHTQSEDGNIKYLGAPYEMTFADVGDLRGFHIFDTDTLELEFIQNPYRMFHKITYDDRDPSKHSNMLNQDFGMYENCQVKLNVAAKTEPYLYDRWLTKLEEANPILQIIETFSLDVDETVDEQFGDFEKGEVVLSDTLTILKSYIDGIGMEIDKNRLHEIMKGLYLEATLSQ